MAMAAAEARLRQEKVKKFEDFVDRRLKPDLVNAIAQRDKVFQQQKTFLDLKRNIENLDKNGVTSMRSMVNLGSEVYMQAEMPDTRHIFVDIGLGFHVEFTWQDASQFISVREARLARRRSGTDGEQLIKVSSTPIFPATPKILVRPGSILSRTRDLQVPKQPQKEKAQTTRTKEKRALLFDAWDE